MGQWWSNIECWFGSFVTFQGIQTSIAKKSYSFVIFQGIQTSIAKKPLSFVIFSGGGVLNPPMVQWSKRVIIWIKTHLLKSFILHNPPCCCSSWCSFAWNIARTWGCWSWHGNWPLSYYRGCRCSCWCWNPEKKVKKKYPYCPASQERQWWHVLFVE